MRISAYNRIAFLGTRLRPAALDDHFGITTLTLSFIQRGAFAIILLAGYAAGQGQAVQVERTERNLSSLFAAGEKMDLYTLGKLDHRSQDQVASNSEATVSKFDLKAPGRARNEYIQGSALSGEE